MSILARIRVWPGNRKMNSLSCHTEVTARPLNKRLVSASSRLGVVSHMAAPRPETLWGYLGNRRGVWGRGPSSTSLPWPPLAVHSYRPGQKPCAQTSPAKRTSWPGVAAAGITRIWHWILGTSLVPCIRLCVDSVAPPFSVHIYS